MNLLRLSLAALLFLCLAPMPYGYFMFVRFAAMGGFVYMGIKEETDLRYIFFGLAILFQPFLKIALGRTVWNVVDVVVAIFLIIMAFKGQQANKLQ